MKFIKNSRWAAIISAAILTTTPSVWAQLTMVGIYPPSAPPITPGTYTPGATFTITGEGSISGYYPNMNFSSGTNSDVNISGDVVTFVYEAVTGDFDKRVRVTGVSADIGNPADTWAQGGLGVRTATNHYSTSLNLVVANPLGTANQVRFTGRSLDGANYTDYGRNYGGVNNVLPNQWIRIRRVGNSFTAYVGTNGTTWSLIAQRYQVLPATLLVGPYANGGTYGVTATATFSDYGNTPISDAIPPILLSAGTLDKQAVGVKFSEAVSSATATVIANYSINQGGSAVTITSIQMGIAGDAVYLGVSGLTNDNFTVTVIGGVQDPSGNTITPNSSVAARALGWNHIDLGIIQNPGSPNVTPGDDPGTKGIAVMINSDENPEVEIIGGGSNAWNPGDFVHYVYRTAPLSGDFDVTIGVSRYDRPGQTAGWANSGLMLRASTYLAGEEFTPAGTQVPMVANTTYLEASAPGRGAIPLWRTAEHGGYGNGNAGFGWPTLINGIKGYYSDLRAINAAGDIDPQSSSDSARYLRIKREGTQYTFYASWDRTSWALVNGPVDLPTLPDQLLLGFSTMGDTGSSGQPLTAYGNNGHMVKDYAIDVTDPFNPLVPTALNTLATGDNNPGRSYMNDGNYVVQRIKIFPNGVTDPLPTTLAFTDIRPADQPPGPPALSGSWTSAGTLAFNMTGGGTGAFQNTGSPDTGGDQLSFAYETVTGDFDKQVRITGLTNTLYFGDGTAYNYSAPVVDTWARAGLMVRSGTNAYNQSLKLVAGNPEGANVVRVMGRGIDGQNYTMFSRDYPGVSNAIPNQYLRMQRVGNSFSFYASRNGTAWSLIGQTYQALPSTVQLGAYCAAGLNPADATGNPEGLISRAVASFNGYDDTANNPTGDLAGPVLVSAGTIDKKTVGVKFNEKVSSATATITANYTLSQGTVTAAQVGIGGDSVYLTVTGLTADTFTVTVSNVKDTLGNTMAANSTVNAKVTGLTSVDIGLIQSPSPRTPTPGDDPYRVGQAVATSSDDAAEVEIVGGGSNAWNPGDFIHWVYGPTPIAGDFDVAVKVSRNDRPNNTAGWANSGLMLRAAVYNAGEDYTVAGTQVPMVANTTYIENSAPGRAAIPLWRTDVHGGYGNGTPVGWPTLVGGIKGYYTGLRGTNSVGDPDPESSAFSARWLRIQRVGTTYNFLWSYDGFNWDTESSSDLPTLGSLFLGYSTMNDSGSGAPPYSAYGGNGHTIDPADPLNPANAGGNVHNESNYSVQKIRLYSSTAAIGSISATGLTSGEVSITFAGTLYSSANPRGPWAIVARQSSPFLIKPAAGARQFYKVLP